jgi:hypothetical protein
VSSSEDFPPSCGSIPSRFESQVGSRVYCRWVTERLARLKLNHLTIPVSDWRRSCDAATLTFVSMPVRQFWGYGAVLADPDGHQIHLYDETSMREKGG